MEIKHHLNLHAGIPNFGYIPPANHSLSEKDLPQNFLQTLLFGFLTFLVLQLQLGDIWGLKLKTLKTSVHFTMC